MGRRICVIDIPGLSHTLLERVPAASALGTWLASQRVGALVPSWPAVTCSVQATLTTGVLPARHGIVGNGLATYRSPQDQRLIDASNFPTYRREVSFWEQSNQLLEVARFWQETSGRTRLKTALLFFQQSMPGFAGAARPAADIVITPKPEHGVDGKIRSLLWTKPREIVETLFEEFGPFPLMNYWGPMAGIASSQWIANAASWVWNNLSPQLQLVYVPHLDYDLQRFGPASPEAGQAVAEMSAALEPLLHAVVPGGEIILLSEYAMTDVSHCVQPNRLLRDAGLLVTRETPDGRLIDYGRSSAFAMVDHQIAHIYLQNETSKTAVAAALRAQPIRILEPGERIEHRRAGDLQIEAEPCAWFDYRWWNTAEEAPVFATQVDIHRKPGYDPLELFFDPSIKGIGQDVTHVRGSHGQVRRGEGIIAGGAERIDSGAIRACDFPTLMTD